LTKQKPKFFIVREAHFLYNKKMKEPSFEEFEATSLYCPHCKSAMPVRKRLLLVLPEGDEYEYLCAYCSTSVGTKIDKSAPPLEILLKP
jgi:DNA-directed RNA polymerase subunit RPC12/RpoP